MSKTLIAELSKECGLTKAVTRVFEHKAVGETSQEIADLLHKSIKTIDAQTTAYLQELDCKNTQEAIAKTVAEGLLTFRYIVKTILIVTTVNLAINDEALRVRNVKNSATRTTIKRNYLT